MSEGLGSANSISQNRLRSHSAAETGGTSVVQSQTIVQGGIFNSAGVQNNYYGEGSAPSLKGPTDKELKLALKDIPNYRDIHGANLSRATEGTGPKFDEWTEYCQWLVPGGVSKTMWGSGMRTS